MKIIYEANSNSSKSEKLKQVYSKLVQDGVDENNILVFSGSNNKELWAGVQVRSFYSIVQSHITIFWNLVSQKIGVKHIKPKFIKMEISEYLINKLVDIYRSRGKFLDINVPSAVLSADILNNISKIALNGIELNEVDVYLKAFVINSDLGVMENISVIKEIINIFYTKNINLGVLNFSLACDLFRKYILDNEFYINYLRDNITHLIVDDLQEKSYLEILFIKKLMSVCEQVHMSYNIDGAITKTLGADMNSAKKLIYPSCLIVNLETSLPICRENIEIKSSLLRSEMINNVIVEIKNAMALGYKLEEIDVICPFVDFILENRLVGGLSKEQINANVMSRSGTFLDNTFVSSIVTVALLCNPNWNIIANKDYITKTLVLLLKLNVVKARALMKDITVKEPFDLPLLEELKYVKLSPDEEVSYKKLRDWITVNRECEMNIDLFFKKFFLDILVPIGLNKENLNSCNYLIRLSQEFLDYALQNSKLNECRNKNFIEMILKGIRVSFKDEHEDTNAIKIWTAFSYILSSKKSKIQIWCDGSSETWYQIGIKKYYNPYIYLKENKDILLEL